MKRILILAVLLAGCYGGHEAAADVRMKLDLLPYSVNLYIDPDTGCQYLTRDGSSAPMTTRIAADGKTHMGCKAVQP
jgi:hypothetical protein